MQRLFKITLLVTLVVSLIASGCSSRGAFGAKKRGCGCPSKKGLVGY